jgi:hypothetical protein
MPVVVIPTCFIDPTNDSPGYTEFRAVNRVLPAILQELFQAYPPLYTRFRRADGSPSTNWFGLFREVDDEDLRDTPELVLGEDERLHLINAIGC